MSDEHKDEKKSRGGSPYDDAFRTLFTDAPELIVPVINEIYHTDFPLGTYVQLLQNERFFEKDTSKVGKRVTDCFIKVGKSRKGRYFHIEMQSTRDGTITLRIFEYGALIGKSLSNMEGNRLIVQLPSSSLLVLRSKPDMPDIMEIELRAPNKERMVLKVPILKIKEYTIGELFRKKLYLLIPFHIFRYEDKLAEYENNEYKLRKVQVYYAEIMKRLDKMALNGQITELQAGLIRRMSLIVIEKIADQYKKIQKGMVEIMGGQVLDYPEKDIFRRGIKIGEKRGEKRGKEIGSNMLIEILDQLYKGKDEKKLMKEYDPEIVKKAVLIGEKLSGKSLL